MPNPGWNKPASWPRDLGLLLILFGALYLFLLGLNPLANPDESRYAEIAREMVAHDDWITPRLNDIPYFEKPPLVYWTVALTRKIFGPGEFAARLTPALFGLGGVLLTYAAARRWFGREAGLGAAVVLGTSALYFGLSRILLMDMVVSVLMSATLFCFILGVREPAGSRRRWLFLGLYASAALATLAKGLIGFLIPGAIMFLWLLIFNQWHRLLPMYLPSGLVVFLALAAPWHVLAAQRNPDWAQFYFVHEHWERFTTTAHARTAPFWFFVPVVLLGIFPWMGFIGCAPAHLLAGGWAKRKENADTWFLVVWTAFVFLFFSKSQSKLIPYVLPLFPPLAVLIGTFVSQRIAEDVRAPLRRGFRVFSFFCGLLAVALVVAVLKPGVIRDATQAADLKPFGLVLAAVLLTGGVLAPWLARVRGARVGLGAMLMTTIAFFAVLALATPALQRAGTKDLALIAKDQVKTGERVYHYWAFFHDFVYYTEQSVGLVDYVDELEVQFMPAAERAARFIDSEELRRQWAGPSRVWVVVRKRDLSHPKAAFAEGGLHYHLIAETRAHSLLSNQPNP